MKKIATIAIAASAFAALAAGRQDDSSAHKEFGDVNWRTKLEPSLDAARDSGKPVMLLFQEVPG